MNLQQQINAVRAANRVAESAKNQGKHPFGAVLIAPDHETVLLEHGNISTVKHAELELARQASEKYEADYLWSCTLATNFEPCVMCTGAIYWANIGRIVYGATEHALLRLTGSHEENPTFAMPCRDVLSKGQKQIEVCGPFDEVEDEVLALHRGFWS